MAKALGLEGVALGPVVRLSVVFAAVGASTAVADTLVQAAFMARAGADALPWVLIVRSVLSPILAFLYTRYARARPSASVLATVAVLNACVALFARFAIETGAGGAIAAYAAHEVASSVLTMHWGIYLLDHLGGAQARRSVAVIYAASRGGAALAGIGLGLSSAYVDAESGLFVASGLFLLIAPLSFYPARRKHHDPLELDPTEPEEGTADADERKRGWQLLRRSPLLVWLCAATLVMVVVRITLRYGQQSILQAYDEATLAGLLGWYTAAANGLGIALQLLLTSRLLRSFGVGTTNLLYAVSTLVAHLAFAVLPGSVGVALAARFTETELKHALKTPVSPLFYGGFWGPDRVRARAFVLGVVSPASQLLGALVLGALVLGDTALHTFGIVSAVLYVGACWAQGKAYERAMARGSLRATKG